MVRESQNHQDPHEGGSIFDMASKGTTIPNDAGKMNTIPSVPRPDQRVEHFAFDNDGLAKPTTATAADNATDMPRSTRDVGQSGEVLTGAGDTLPAAVESKRAYMGNNVPGAPADSRSQKHDRQNRGAFDTYAHEDEESWDAVGESQATK